MNFRRAKPRMHQLSRFGMQVVKNRDNINENEITLRMF